MDESKAMLDSAGLPNTDQQKTQIRDSRVKRSLGWLVLTVFGSVVGATVGYVNFIQLPPLYKATAQIQIVHPAKEIPIASFDRMDTRLFADELVVVRSSAVLTTAVELGGLSQHRGLSGKSAAEIVRMLKDPKTKMLDVRLGSHDRKSDIIVISVTTGNADLSAAIAQAIVSGYEYHINTISKGAQLALTESNDNSEKAVQEAKAELDTLRLKIGVKSVARLEIPTMGSFAGPYWFRLVGLGTLFGFCAFIGLAFIFLLADKYRERLKSPIPKLS